MAIRAFSTALWKRTSARFAIIFGVVVAAGSVVALMSSRADSVGTAFSQAEWVYRHAATPWVGVLVLAVIGTLFWVGVIQARNSIAQGNRADQIAWANETKIRNAAVAEFMKELDYTKNLVHYFMFKQQSEQELHALKEYQARIDRMSSFDIAGGISNKVKLYQDMQMLFLELSRGVWFFDQEELWQKEKMPALLHISIDKVQEMEEQRFARYRDIAVDEASRLFSICSERHQRGADQLFKLMQLMRESHGGSYDWYIRSR